MLNKPTPPIRSDMKLYWTRQTWLSHLYLISHGTVLYTDKRIDRWTDRVTHKATLPIWPSRPLGITDQRHPPHIWPLWGSTPSWMCDITSSLHPGFAVTWQTMTRRHVTGNPSWQPQVMSHFQDGGNPHNGQTGKPNYSCPIVFNFNKVFKKQSLQVHIEPETIWPQFF